MVAVDIHPVDCRCFDLARQLLGSKATYHQMSVYELNADALGGPFDLVMCLGVYYHLRHLLLALDNLWAVARGEPRLETHVLDERFLLAHATATRLRDVDERLTRPRSTVSTASTNSGNDYSNCTSGSWNDRAMFKARKSAALPREWEKGSYEGTRFVSHPDGTWTSLWIDPRKAGMPDRTPGTPK